MPTADAYKYLGSEAQADLVAASPYLPSFAESPTRVLSDQFRRDLPMAREPLMLLASDDWQVRAGALLGLPPAWPTEPSYVAAVFQAALDDTDARVRGTALAVIAEEAMTDNARSLAQYGLAVIKTRFPSPSGSSDATILTDISDWLALLPLLLNGLRTEAGTRRYVAERAKQEAAEVARLADDDLDYLIGDASHAIEFLCHRLPSRRRAALIVVSKLENLSRGALDKVLTIVVSDPDRAVRLQAVKATVHLFRDANDHQAKRALARVVERDLHDQELWSAAYNGIFDVAGRPYSEWPGLRALDDGRDPYLLREEDIDWAYIAECSDDER